MESICTPIFRNLRIMQRFARPVAVPIGIAAILALAVLTTPFANAQQGTGTGTPVLVIVDDEDRDTVKRSSAIAKSILAALASAMPRFGLRMVDGERVARDLELHFPDRIPTAELIDALQIAGMSDKGEHFHRASLLLQLRVRARNLGHGVRIQVGVNGWIHAARSGQLLDAIELPPEILGNLLAPVDCLGSPGCIEGVVGDRAQEIAELLARLVALKLDRYPGLEPWGTESNAEGDINRYVVTMRNFLDMEALVIAGVMREEFPGSGSVELIRKSRGARTYEYMSSAAATELDEWFGILLRDMGFDTAGDVMVTLDGAEIIIEKVSPAASGDANE